MPRRILGLTGSVAMGKSTAARMLNGLGCRVHDADAVVHALMAPGGAAVGPVSAAFEGVLAADGGIDRQALGRQVLSQPAELRRLEAIVHPLVTAERERFMRRTGRKGAPIVLDIPLLFETGSQKSCDMVAVVSAPAFVQRQRFLARSGATEEKFRAILAQQVPDAAKRRLADHVVPSGLGKAATLRALRRVCKLTKAANHRQLSRRAARRRLSTAILTALGEMGSRPALPGPVK